jgi:hypothetical protein
VDRRSVLATAAAAAIGAPAAALLGAGPARASASYQVAVCEQYENQVQIYPSTSAWSSSTLVWKFAPGTTGGWSNLSDVKFRSTAAFGEVALVTASGGYAGIVDVTSKTSTGTGDLLWYAAPGNNPHAIERIPNIGAIVVASSGGFLSVYGPTAVSDPSTLALVQTISYDGAHGVWWDDVHGRLWAIGQGRATPFTVTGTYRSTRLSATEGDATFGDHLGHSLDASYADSSILLGTHGSGVISIDKATHAVTTISGTSSVKAYSRDSSGESFWVRATGTTYHGDTRNWVSPTVQFFDSSGAASFTRSLSYGAEFYKSRLHNVAFH